MDRGARWLRQGPAAGGEGHVHVNVRPRLTVTYDRATRTATWPDDGGADAIIATRSWLDGARRYAIPSLRDVPGWSSAWEPASARVDVHFRWSKTAPLGAGINHGQTLWSRMRTGDRVERSGAFVDPDAY